MSIPPSCGGNSSPASKRFTESRASDLALLALPLPTPLSLATETRHEERRRSRGLRQAPEAQPLQARPVRQSQRQEEGHAQLQHGGKGNPWHARCPDG